jgi:hypothetical protein
MSAQPDNPHYVRRVVLPSGKTIEVVYFEDTTAAAPGVPADVETTGLHVCGGCASELVYPTAWEEAGPHHWEVSLRCPNCHWEGTGVFGQELVERFDEELDRGTEAVVRDLRRLAQANMEAEVDRFVRALDAGHIVPEDF